MSYSDFREYLNSGTTSVSLALYCSTLDLKLNNEYGVQSADCADI